MMRESDETELLLQDLSAEQIAPLERAFPPGFPDTWRDFARSHYVTLLQRPGVSQSRQDMADLAVALARGIGRDMGGSQPYIPVGQQVASDARTLRVLNAFRGNNHAEVARLVGLTEARVRQIVAAAQRERYAGAQSALDLE